MKYMNIIRNNNFQSTVVRHLFTMNQQKKYYNNLHRMDT